MASPGKLQEGDRLMAEGDKSLKTSLFKWSPDYDTAASCYERAAICYRNSRCHQKSKDAYLKASESHYNNNAIYHSGKSLEQAANVCRDVKELLEAGDLMKKACERFNESGHPDTGGQVLAKAAQWLQHDEPETSAVLFLMTSDYLVLDDKLREGANAVKDAVRMYCRTRPRQLEKVIETSKKAREALISAQMINIAHELVAVEVIALLSQGNTMEARETLQEAESVVGFASSDDYTTLDDLIEAVSSHDNESIVQCCDSGVFKAMDPEFTKLVRDLKIGNESGATCSSQTSFKANETSVKHEAAVITKNPAVLAIMRNELLTKKSINKKEIRDTPLEQEEATANEEGIEDDTIDIN